MLGPADEWNRSGRKLVFRLTAQRAKAMGATKLLPQGEQRLVWRPTRKDREKRRDLPEDAQIQGRLIAVTCNGFRQPWYLFTTLPDTLEAVAGLYAQRWHMELDLRTLKRTLRLEHLRGKSREAVDKELLIAVVAYGLVRAFMALAARRAGVAPRQISFTRAYGLLDIAIRKLCSANPEEREQSFERVLCYLAKSKLPNRSKRRSYPRAVWGSRQSFPSMETVTKRKADCK